MAGNFSVVSHVRTVRVIGPTLVVDVEQVGFVTHPTGIYAEYPVPYSAWTTEGAGVTISPLADAIEGVISGGLAVTGSYAEDIDASGLLVGYIDFVVEYDPPGGFLPPQQTSVRVTMDSLAASSDPFFAALGGSPQGKLSAAYDRLVADMNL